jgi:hypothetical protein
MVSTVGRRSAFKIAIAARSTSAYEGVHLILLQ